MVYLKRFSLSDEKSWKGEYMAQIMPILPKMPAPNGDVISIPKSLDLLFDLMVRLIRSMPSEHQPQYFKEGAVRFQEALAGKR